MAYRRGMRALDLWASRLAWLVQPFTLGPLIGEALTNSEPSLRTGASVGAWAVWGLVLAALLVPRAQTLTIVRIWVPAAVPAAIWASIAVGDTDAAATLAIAAALIAAALVLVPTVGTAFVDGSSYGDERRYPLRPGAPILLGPIQAAWAVTVAGATLGPLALLDHRWVLGAVLAVVGVPLALAATRALHQLARRWVVFVPAGFVLHDPAVLREPVLFPRTTIAAVGPAPAESDADDLTSQAPGLALRLRLDPATSYVPASRRGDAEAVETEEIMFTPTRPGAVLRTAAERHLTVG